MVAVGLAVVVVLVIVVVAAHGRPDESAEISAWHDGLDALDRLEERHRR